MLVDFIVSTRFFFFTKLIYNEKKTSQIIFIITTFYQLHGFLYYIFREIFLFSFAKISITFLENTE